MPRYTLEIDVHSLVLVCAENLDEALEEALLDVETTEEGYTLVGVLKDGTRQERKDWSDC